MTQATQRTHKLLIFMGDQGTECQKRDYARVVQIIVNGFLSTAKPAYEEFLTHFLPTVIRRIPFKQHFYAGLTMQILKVKPQLASSIIKNAAANLQKDLNNLKLHQSTNGILYLSELMNLQKLNSQCFLDLVDDIVAEMEKCKNANHRAFFVSIFSRTLHNFCYSLNKKVYFQFKKLMQRSKKYCSKNIQFSYLYQSHQKGTLNDGSIMHRAFSQAPPKTQHQFQQNIKLKITLNDQQIFTPVEYQFPVIDQSDKLYQQYLKNQGQIHITIMQQIIELMKQNSSFMSIKLMTYIHSQTYKKNSFMDRLSIDFIVGKALKSKTTVVQCLFFIKLMRSNAVYGQLIFNALAKGIYKQCENYDLLAEMKFTQIISYLVNCWPSEAQIPQLGHWDWEKFVHGLQDLFQNTQQNGQKKYYKQPVLLKIICQKILLLNENFNAPPCIKMYMPPEQLRNPTKYKQIQQMQVLENFQLLLKQKSKHQAIIPNINSQSDFEIFLEALFQVTSQSHTHLQVLMSRYEKVFEKYKQDYDWVLLNTIRSYWTRSLFHRLFYLEFVIEKGFVDFESYVKYISKVETGSEEQKHWVRLELNQLLSKFGKQIRV